jgi:hypothetical protein
MVSGRAIISHKDICQSPMPRLRYASRTQLPYAGGGRERPRSLHLQPGMPPERNCPTRAAAGSGRAPCTLGPGLRPWQPRFDVIACSALGAHAYGQLSAGSARFRLCPIISSASSAQHNRGMCRCSYLGLSITCRGFRGRRTPPAGSARGGAASQRMHQVLHNGEREGQCPSPKKGGSNYLLTRSSLHGINYVIIYILYYVYGGTQCTHHTTHSRASLIAWY